MYGRHSPILWFIAALGVALIGYGAYQWFNRPQLTDKQLKGSVELNYQLDVFRKRLQSGDGKINISDQWKRKHHAAIREQIQAHMKKQRETAKSWMLAGLAALIFSLGRMFLLPRFRNSD